MYGHFVRNRTEEQRRWFVSLELDLFRMKLTEASTPEKKEFLKKLKFPGDIVQ
jgi:hypothetical protein